MEPLDAVKRKQNFEKSVEKPFEINDSRFGLRRFFLNEQEKPKIATYRTSGKGPNGEHQN